MTAFGRARDKVNLDIFWLRNESLEDTANLPDPEVLPIEIVEDLQAALEQFSEIAEDVGEQQSPRCEMMRMDLAMGKENKRNNAG